MKFFRKIIWGVVALLILGVVLAFVVIRPVDYTPYFQTGYYAKTMVNLRAVDTALHHAKPAPLFVGFGKASITPPVGTPLAGYGDRKGKPSVGVHDSLFVRAIALKSGGQEAILVAGDILIVPRQLADSVLAEIHPKLGIDRRQILFGATHSHSAVGAWGTTWLEEQFAGKNDPKILHFLIRQFVAAIEQATAHFERAEVGWGNFHAPGLIRNRLIGKKGWIDDQAVFTAFRTDSGKQIVLVSFGAHATVLPASNFLISADYPGYLERKLERALPGHGVFFAGGVGSHRPAGKGKDFDRAKMIGEALADSVLFHLKTTSFHANVPLLPVGVPVALPSYTIRISDNLRLAPFLAAKILKERDTFFNAVLLGKEIFIGIPAELSGEIGLVLKALAFEKGLQLVPTSFNGSYLGYVVPGKYYHYNAYESRLMSFYGPYMGDYFEEIARRLLLVAWHHTQR